MDKKPQVIVVGGGAAGLTAGIMAARNGAAVTILEQNEKPGRKICMTGNGRCNLTNQEMSWEKFHGQNPAFVRDILSQFSLEDTLKFFDELGIVVTDKKGNVLVTKQIAAAYEAGNGDLNTFLAKMGYSQADIDITKNSSGGDDDEDELLAKQKVHEATGEK